MTVARTTALVILTCMALASCDRGTAAAPAPDEILQHTAEHLDDIRSGNISMSFMLTGEGGEQVGYRMAGVFASESDALTADIRTTTIAGGRETESRFVSWQGRQYVEVNGRTYELQPSGDLSAGATVPAGSTLAQLGFSRWLRGEATVSSTQGSDGTPAWHLEGDVDPALALPGILSLAAHVGADGDIGLDRAGAEHLRRAVRSATMALVVGSEDSLLRRLELRMELGVDPTSPFARELAGRDVTFGFVVSIDAPNQSIEVQPPAHTSTA